MHHAAFGIEESRGNANGPVTRLSVGGRQHDLKCSIANMVCVQGLTKLQQGRFGQQSLGFQRKTTITLVASCALKNDGARFAQFRHQRFRDAFANPIQVAVFGFVVEGNDKNSRVSSVQKRRQNGETRTNANLALLMLTSEIRQLCSLELPSESFSKKDRRKPETRENTSICNCRSVPKPSIQ